MKKIKGREYSSLNILSSFKEANYNTDFWVILIPIIVITKIIIITKTEIITQKQIHLNITSIVSFLFPAISCNQVCSFVHLLSYKYA